MSSKCCRAASVSYTHLDVYKRQTIDGKLEELTSAFLNGEMENINIAATVDEIQGLVVDIYR